MSECLKSFIDAKAKTKISYTIGNIDVSNKLVVNKVVTATKTQVKGKSLRSHQNKVCAFQGQVSKSHLKVMSDRITGKVCFKSLICRLG